MDRAGDLALAINERIPIAVVVVVVRLLAHERVGARRDTVHARIRVARGVAEGIGHQERIAVAVMGELGLTSESIGDLRQPVQDVVVEAGLLAERVGDGDEPTATVGNARGGPAGGRDRLD